MAKAKTYKILLIEDNPAMNKVYRNRLTSEGFEVVSAMDGQEGLDAAIKDKPDIVLLDLVMPKMDGFDVLVEIRKKYSKKKLPVIILSNLGQKSDIEKADKLGSNDYLVKADFSLIDAVKRIRQHLK
jgi:DNA-binding response OmpR family regulator